MTTKTGNKEHIGGNGNNDMGGGPGHEPIKGEDGRMDFTKSGKAYQIFDEMHKKDSNVARKDCLERAVAEADMTPASAATFYQKWRDDNGMVHRDEDDGRSNNGGNGNNDGRTGRTEPVEVKGATVKGSGGGSGNGGSATAGKASGHSSTASKGSTGNKSSKK